MLLWHRFFSHVHTIQSVVSNGITENAEGFDFSYLVLAFKFLELSGFLLLVLGLLDF